jgi:hypothetical protein
MGLATGKDRWREASDLSVTSPKGIRMKVKTLVACAITASALPFASWAQSVPTGPQGTSLSIAEPVAFLTFAQVDTNGDGFISREEYAVVERIRPGTIPGSGPLTGPSFDTNPPVPAP